jgi:hypothetical protein
MSQERLDLEAVDRHFLAVNQVGPGTFAQHKKEAGRLFLRRAKVRWRIDFGRGNAYGSRKRNF